MTDKRIKILVDCHVFDHGFQGTRTYIEGLYKAFIPNKNFMFYLVAEKPEIIESVFGRHENVHYVSYKSKNRFSRLLFEIPKIIRENAIDYTHFQYIVSPFKKGRYIVTTHDALFIDFPAYFPVLNRIKKTFLYHQSAKLADVRLTVSEYSRQKMKEHFNLSDYNITPNAVQDAFFEDYDKQAIRKKILKKYKLDQYIIYISRWEPRKKHDLVLKAFLDLQLHDSHQLVFIGDTTFKNEAYQALYRPLEKAVKEKIISIEKTDFDTMITLLRGAKASVYPSIAEGFGIPPLEALAAKIPTLCSDKTAMSDFDFFGEFLFDPYDEEGFKAKLSDLLQNDYSQRFAAITQQMAEKYNWGKSAQVLEKAILEHYNR